MSGERLVMGVYGIVSVITCAAYGRDKFAAIRGDRRVRERTLHLLALCGGWPGALAAQLAFRHKIRKPSFQLIFWLTVLANGAMLYAWRRDSP